MLKYTVNRQLLPLKGHYFLWNAGTSPVVPFLSSYARKLGFSSIVVGLVYTILPMSGMLAKPLIGGLADRFKCRKQFFLAAQLLTAIAFLAINYAPDVPVERKVHFSCDYNDAVFDTSQTNASVNRCLVSQLQNESGVINCRLDCRIEDSLYWDVICRNWSMPQYCDVHPNRLKFTAHVPKTDTESFGVETVIFAIRNVTMDDGMVRHPVCSCGDKCPMVSECDIECDDFNVNEILASPVIRNEDVYSLYQFWVFLVLMVVAWVGQAVVVSVGDAICFEMLGDKPNRYGYQRMYGSLGWGIFSTGTGFMVDKLSEGQANKNYTSAFYLASAFLFCDFLVSYKIQYTQKKVSRSIFRDVITLLVNARIIIFIVWCILVGMCTGLGWQFLFWLIEDLVADTCSLQNRIKTLQGLVMTVQCLLGELPFFFLSSSILKRIGHVNSMTLVLLSVGVKFILYSVITNPWWFLPVELLSGLSFGLFYSCMASYASFIAPPGAEATMQGLVGAVFEGVGVSLGSFIGGILYHEYGGPWTFRFFGVCALVCCLVHAGVQFVIARLCSSDSDGGVYHHATYTIPKEMLDKFRVDDQQELALVN